jgi:transcription initiation factor TFIIIB Brf1 subunit/transcription initiation factor TFIIB
LLYARYASDVLDLREKTRQRIDEICKMIRGEETVINGKNPRVMAACVIMKALSDVGQYRLHQKYDNNAFIAAIFNITEVTMLHNYRSFKARLGPIEMVR